MLSVLVFSFNAIAPILLLILVGYIGRRWGLVDEAALKKINRLNFRFGFCALMFVNIYSLESTENTPWNLVLFILAALIILTAVGWVLTNLLTEKRERKPVLMMAAFRSNYAIIGLVLTEAVAGQAGLQIATIIQLPTVLYFNLVGTLVLSVYGGTGKIDLRKLLRELAENPLIQGILAGGLAVWIRQWIPLDSAGNPVFTLTGNLPWLYTTLSYLARMSTPLAIIVLGGQLELKEAAEFRRELAGGVAMRLVLAPVVGFGLAALAQSLGWISLDAACYAMMIAAFGSPLAVSAVVMSAEMGADDRLCGQLVVWSCILSMPSMFVLTSILRFLGLV